MPKKKNSLDDEIYFNIKRAILNRKLAPGTKLPEGDLARVLDVSRTPIRQALKRLSYEMLVTILPNKGAYVSKPTPQEVKNVFEMRMVIEDYSVRKACEYSKGNENFFTRIEKSIEIEKQAYAEENIPGVLKKVEDIHIEIAKISGNQILVNQLRDLVGLTNLYITFFSKVLSKNPRSPEEHLNILQAIKKGDTVLATTLMHQHISDILSRMDFNLIQRTHAGIESVFNINHPIS